MSLSKNVHFTPSSCSPLIDAAHHIVSNAKSLPDLSSIKIILAEPALAPAFRRELLSVAHTSGHNALLSPEMLSYVNWLNHCIPEDINICADQSRLLILVEALLNAPALLGQANPWNLADSLLGLFDELTLNRIQLDDDPHEFASRLANWYAINHTKFEGLQHEASLVHQLWQAWHTQLQAQGLTDPASAQVQALQRSLQVIDIETEIHFVDFVPQYNSQLDWFKQLKIKPNVHFWIHGQPRNAHNLADAAMYSLAEKSGLTPKADVISEPYELVLHSVFDTNAHLADRAKKIVSTVKYSPLKERLAIFSSHNAEQEALAVDLQVRKWILAGKQRIGIVTENRRLARRVRALLERADIFLQDSAGWALSTTRAAAIIESLLLCIEDDFASDALLDLLKSPLLFPDMDAEILKKLTWRLEHDIIRNEGIANNLSRYRQAIVDRQVRLREIWSVPPSAVIALLDRINDTTQPLQLVQKERTTSLLVYLQALINSLQQTGIYASLQQDAAGLQILKAVENMLQAAEQHSFDTHWYGFRAWLGRNLESHYFRPAQTDSPVQLFSLGQARSQIFDAIVIAGVEQNHLPGSPARTPFFNDTVRQQLELPARNTFIQQRLHDFYNLLFAAPEILLTHRREENGEPVPESPWLAAIRSFHQQAWQDDLQNVELHEQLACEKNRVIRSDTKELPGRQPRPEPVVSEAQLPTTISASAYQQLLECPYQFFAARCLLLKPPEEVQKVLSKREYGERVHLCLQAFHSDTRFPGPFREIITENNRTEAIALMQEIAEAVFQYDLQDNYTHRGWYHQWLEVIPEYINWQMIRNQSVQISSIEDDKEIVINEILTIKGRLDRVDANDKGLYIVDYKTGSIPSKYEIENGEKIQLPFYALLAQQDKIPVESVEYLNVGKAKDFASKFPQTGELLGELAEKVSQRLQTIVQQLHEHKALPAWESDKVCQYCDMNNLCRKDEWDSSDPTTPLAKRN